MKQLKDMTFSIAYIELNSDTYEVTIYVNIIYYFAPDHFSRNNQLMCYFYDSHIPSILHKNVSEHNLTFIVHHQCVELSNPGGFSAPLFKFDKLNWKKTRNSKAKQRKRTTSALGCVHGPPIERKGNMFLLENIGNGHLIIKHNADKP